jgi:hypothetical protein
MSGVVVSQECVEAAAKVWSRKSKDVGFCSFKLEGDATIVVDQVGCVWRLARLC